MGFLDFGRNVTRDSQAQWDTRMRRQGDNAQYFITQGYQHLLCIQLRAHANEIGVSAFGTRPTSVTWLSTERASSCPLCPPCPEVEFGRGGVE